MGILELLLAFILLVAFPLGEVARLQFGNGVAFTLLDLSIGIFALCFILKHHLKKGMLFIPILIFAAVMIISILAQTFRLPLVQQMVAALYILRWIAYASIYFAALNFSIKNKKLITALIFACGTLVGLVGVVQYLWYPYLGNLRYAGWDEHLYRLFSSFFDPNFAGAFLALFALFLIGKIFQKKIGRTGYLLYGAILAFTLVCLALTYSRTAYLMLGFGVLAFALVMPAARRWILPALGIIVVMVIGLILLINKHSEGTNFLRTASTLARLTSFENAWVIFRENPVLGVGFDAYRHALISHGFISGANALTSHGASSTDNSWLFALATTGIIGFISYLYLWLSVLKLGWITKDGRAFVVPIVVAVIVGSMFTNILFYPAVMLWMWIMIGFTENNLL